MTIIINNKSYNLSMRIWDGSHWGPDEAEEIIIDSGFSWDEAECAWRTKGDLDDLESFLQDWESYNTDADRYFYNDQESREQAKEEHPRSYDLEEK